MTRSDWLNIQACALARANSADNVRTGWPFGYHQTADLASAAAAAAMVDRFPRPFVF